MALLARYDSLKIELDNIVHLLRDQNRQVGKHELAALIRKHLELLEESYEISDTILDQSKRHNQIRTVQNSPITGQILPIPKPTIPRV